MNLPADIARVEQVIRLMRQYGAVRVKLPDLEIDMGPAPATTIAPIEAAPAPSPDELERACDCGHSLLAEHNEYGCLRGCSMTACAKSAEAEPEPT